MFEPWVVLRVEYTDLGPVTDRFNLGTDEVRQVGERMTEGHAREMAANMSKHTRERNTRYCAMREEMGE